MVGLVIVSHSAKLAEGVIDLVHSMAPETLISSAGGLENGGFGTSKAMIKKAIEEVYSDDGVVVLMDLGSAMINAEEVVTHMGKKNIKIIDCPLVEGAVATAVVASENAPLQDVMRVVNASRTSMKF